MKVTKAVITAAGRGVRLYPTADTVQKAMLPLVDSDGIPKPVIQIIAEDALTSGIEDVCIVCGPDDETHYLRRFRFLKDNLLQVHGGAPWAHEQAERLAKLLGCLSFAVQEEPLGFGHAVYCARAFADSRPFLLMLGDHVHVPASDGRTGAEQIAKVAERTGHSVSAVQATPEHLVPNYGTLAGTHVPELPGLYRIERVAEKPSVSFAELHLHTPGLRAGHFLCLLGLHVLVPEIFEVLEERLRQADPNGGEYHLTPALQTLAQQQPCYACEVSGCWHDLSRRYGPLRTQLALGLAGRDRTEVLSTISEVLIEAQQRSNSAAGA